MDFLRIQTFHAMCTAAALISMARKRKVEPGEIEKALVESLGSDESLFPQYREVAIGIVRGTLSMFKPQDVINLADSSQQTVGFDSPDFEATILKEKLDENIIKLLDIVKTAQKFMVPIKHKDDESPFPDMLIAHTGLSVFGLLNIKNLEWTEANFKSEITGLGINELNNVIRFSLLDLLKRSERNKYSHDDLAVALNLIDIPQVNEANEESVKSQIFNRARGLALDID